MIARMEPIAFLLGILLTVLVLWDLFETIVVPRPTPGWFRISRYVIRFSWRAFRAVGRDRRGKAHDTLLGLFAPAATLALLIVWLATLIVGYGLVLFALRDQISPRPADLGTTIYFAATSVLTLGFGDFVAAGPAARAVVVLSAASGLGVVALVVTFLFSLFGSYRRREVQVVTLQAAAGAPPSAVQLLKTYGPARPRGSAARLVRRMGALGAGGPRHPRRISAAGVLSIEPRQPVMDQRPGDGSGRGQPRPDHDRRGAAWRRGALPTRGLPPRRGHHKPRLSSRSDSAPERWRNGLDGARSHRLRRSMRSTGADRIPPCPAEEAWRQFEAARAAYAGRLEAMAAYWAAPTNSWLGAETGLRSPAPTD